MASVVEGRRKEFKSFGAFDQTFPDPQDPATFEHSKLNWGLAEREGAMLNWYRSLLALRRDYVIDGERTCHAGLVEGVIHLQVPAEEPRVKVLARIQGAGPLPAAMRASIAASISSESL